jgi:hypothetical protein
LDDSAAAAGSSGSLENGGEDEARRKIYGATVSLTELSSALGVAHRDALAVVRGASNEGKFEQPHESGTAWEWSLHDQDLVSVVALLQAFAASTVEEEGGGAAEEPTAEECKGSVVSSATAAAQSPAGLKNGDSSGSATAVTARLVNAARDADWLEHYKHCHHRCSYMSDKQLERRVKTISKAQGRNCVTKLDVFEQVLRDMDRPEIADECAAALKAVRGAIQEEN